MSSRRTARGRVASLAAEAHAFCNNDPSWPDTAAAQQTAAQWRDARDTAHGIAIGAFVAFTVLVCRVVVDTQRRVV